MCRPMCRHRNIGTRHPLRTSANQCLRSADTNSKKNYGWHCAELSPRAIANILSLTANEQQVLLLGLTNVHVPALNCVNTSRQGQAAVASRLRGQSYWRQGNWSRRGRQFQISQVFTRDVWTASRRRSANILEINGLTQFTKICGRRQMRILLLKNTILDRS